MTQWGSKSLGDQGYSPIEIIRHFYGSDMYVNAAEQISGIPSSWPGYNLSVGSSGAKVRQLQEQLDTIAEVYTIIPRIAADGIFGERTREAVQQFQSTFGLPQTGVVDFRPSSSQATVTIFTWPPLASLRRANISASGLWRFSAAWAPRFWYPRKGPSRWMPAH